MATPPPGPAPAPSPAPTPTPAAPPSPNPTPTQTPSPAPPPRRGIQSPPPVTPKSGWGLGCLTAIVVAIVGSIALTFVGGAIWWLKGSKPAIHKATSATSIPSEVEPDSDTMKLRILETTIKVKEETRKQAEAEANERAVAMAAMKIKQREYELLIEDLKRRDEAKQQERAPQPLLANSSACNGLLGQELTMCNELEQARRRQ
jgi:hypothetical protein